MKILKNAWKAMKSHWKNQQRDELKMHRTEVHLFILEWSENKMNLAGNDVLIE